MNSNIENNGYPFLDGENDSNIFYTLKDLFQIFLHNLHWFLLSTMLGAVLAVWYVNSQDHIYASSAKILIKDPDTSTSDIRDSELLNNVTNRKIGTFSLASLTTRS